MSESPTIYGPAQLVNSTTIGLFVTPPPAVGVYDLGNVSLVVTRKPTYLQRLAIKLVFGWTWRDLPQ